MRQVFRFLILILSFLFLSINTFPSSITIQNSDTCQIHPCINKIMYQNGIPEKTDKDTFFEKSIPWLIALLIGILSTLTNIFVSNRLNKSNSENVTKQTANAKEIVLTQFKSTIHSQNMQKWSDELREDLSEFLAVSAYIRAKMSDSRKKTDEEIFDYIIDDFKILNKYKVKLLTLLNINNPDEKIIADKIVLLMQKGFVTKEEFTAKEHIQLENTLLSDSRTLFQKHWEKIRNLEQS